MTFKWGGFDNWLVSTCRPSNALEEINTSLTVNGDNFIALWIHKWCGQTLPQKVSKCTVFYTLKWFRGRFRPLHTAAAQGQLKGTYVGCDSLLGDFDFQVYLPGTLASPGPIILVWEGLSWGYQVLYRVLSGRVPIGSNRVTGYRPRIVVAKNRLVEFLQ